MIGKTISHYKIVEKLGEGGMGVVYKAQDQKLDRFVALKFLPSQFGADEEQKARFIQEAKAASSIDHPNIASVYEIDETDDGQFFIAMGYYEGETLKSKIQAGPLPIEQSLDFAGQIAQGLAKAHEHGIVHRDLKPANVLITSHGVAKIIDFGLAKVSAGQQLTRSGTSVGTVAYMSPEQAQGEEVDVGTDIWSLGVIMYEMLSGRLPFAGQYEAAMIYSIVNEDPPSLLESRKDVPLDYVNIIEKAMKRNRRDRYQRMDDLIQDLTTLRRNLEAGTATETSKQLASRLVKTVLRKRRTPIIVGSGALVVLVALFIFWRIHHATPDSALNRSLAVVPFVNVGDTSDNYFAEGFRHDLTHALSKLPQALVISPHSVSSFEGLSLTDSSIASQLGVRFIVRGQLQLSVARLKLGASLFDAEAGSQVWNESYDRSRGEAPAIRDEVIKIVGSHLAIDLDKAGMFAFKTKPDVYEPYLHGLFLAERKDKQDNKLAIAYFAESISRDSNYVPSMTGLAGARIQGYKRGWDKSDRSLKDAEDVCRTSLKLDSTEATALAMLGSIADLRGDRQKAISLLLKAYEKDHKNNYALTSLGEMYLLDLNEPAKGVMYLKQLEEIEPRDWLVNSNLGVGYAQLKNYAEAKKSFHKSIRLDPDRDTPPYDLAYVCERIGENDSAILYYERALRNNPRFLNAYEGLFSNLLSAQKFALAESVITAGLSYIQSQPELYYDLGLVYAFKGKQSGALRAFQDGLKLIEESLAKDPGVADNHALAGLFSARLGNVSRAIAEASEAAGLDSTNEDVVIKVARIYAALGKKDQMLAWYRRAKSMNPEYDAAYLKTAMDFENYRKDPDLLLVARQE